MYIVASHILYKKINQETYGPSHSIYDYLKQRNWNTCFIKLDLNDHGIREYINAKGKKILEINKNKNYFKKNILDVFFILKFTVSKSNYTYIGVDPLNGFTGAILKLINSKIKFIYFSVDYADRRFDNLLTNFIYHFMDRISLYFSDQIWCVSSRLLKKRMTQGVNKNKLILLPNSPLDLIKPSKYNGNYNLVIVSNLEKTIDFESVFKIIKILSMKYKNIKLNIIGSGTEDKPLRQFVKKLKITPYVTFLGQKNHTQVVKIINRSFLGFALYTKKNSWNIYGDSMKTREYIACGIPVIMNDIPSTSEDVIKYEAGLVLHKWNNRSGVNKISLFIEKCITNLKYYYTLRNNVKSMSKNYNKKRILDEIL